jgi:L-rhamnonate dehydratase
MGDVRITRIEWARLSGERPRVAGCNARLGEHGLTVRPGIARISTDEGASGFGWSRITRDEAEGLVGSRLGEAFDPRTGVAERWRGLEYPLWDLAGQMAQKPVYAMVGGPVVAEGAYRVLCYDTSLYMDDLHLQDDRAAAALMVEEALQGAAKGHRHFKIKVGRGAMHMPLEEGTRRDITIVRAVREAVGPQARIMLDANNGYNLNLTTRVLGETAEARMHWMEEPFHEDPRLYTNLKTWLSAQGLDTLIADGEGDASPNLINWAREGLIDVIQYDILYYGFTRWSELGPQLDGWGLRSAPHHYGGFYGNYAACHIASRIARLEAVEWDEARVPGVDASAYAISDGHVHVPALPGFGLRLEESIYRAAMAEGGFAVRL